MNQKTSYVGVLIGVILIIALLVFFSSGKNNKTNPPANYSPTAPKNITTKKTDNTTTQPSSKISDLPYKDGISDLPLMSETNASLGLYLTDTNGFTLYVYKLDGKQQSNCNDKCVETWIPFIYFAGQVNLKTYTDPLTQNLNITKRADNNPQFSWGQAPLYYYSGDKKAGAVNGNGLEDGNWSVVKLKQ